MTCWLGRIPQGARSIPSYPTDEDLLRGEGHLWDSRGLPSQAEGWKLHLSLAATSEAINRSMGLLHRLFLEQGIPYKIASSARLARDINAGRHGWSQAGKIATLYPSSDGQAVDVVGFLEGSLRVDPGPAIDGDIRVSTSVPAYARWGSFHSAKRNPTRAGLVTDIEGQPHKDDRRRPQHEMLGRVPPFTEYTTSAPYRTWAERYVPMRLLVQTWASIVYAAYDLETRQWIALKVRRRRMAVDGAGYDSVDRLRREFYALKNYHKLLSGPTPISYWADEDWGVLAMSFIEGKTLDHISKSPAERRSVARQMPLLLQAASENKLLLRDLHPSNLLLDVSGTLRLVDFEFVGSARDSAQNVMEVSHDLPHWAFAGLAEESPDLSGRPQ